MKPGTIVSVFDPSSRASEVALARALSLAGLYGATLHVLQAGHARRPADDRADARRSLNARIERMRDRTGTRGVEFVTALLPTGGVRPIADYAERVAADLVVVPKVDQRWLNHWPAGSVESALGKAVKAPTLTIAAEQNDAVSAKPLFDRVVVAVDFSPPSRGALAAALALVQRSGGHLTVLHVLTGFPHEEVYSASRALRLVQDQRTRVATANRELQALIPAEASNWADIEVVTVSGRPHEAILSAASGRDATAIVLGLPRRSRLEEVLVGSTVHGVLRRAVTPVLLVPGTPLPDRIAETPDRQSPTTMKEENHVHGHRVRRARELGRGDRCTA